jgi:hypothetical protein
MAEIRFEQDSTEYDTSLTYCTTGFQSRVYELYSTEEECISSYFVEDEKSDIIIL